MGALLPGRVALSPVGRTEPNPFELGHQGLWHQQIQFGEAGTWGPILSLTLGRFAGPLELRLSGIARLALAENEHGYRASNR